MSLRVRVRKLPCKIIGLLLISFPLLLVTEFHNNININFTNANNLNYKIRENFLVYYNSLSSSMQMDIQWDYIEQNIKEGNLNRIITDTNGNSIVIGSEGDDIMIQKYSILGEVEWNTTWGGAEIDKAEAIAIDNSSNIYITGYTESFGAMKQDIIVLKYNSSGNTLWERRIDLGGTEGQRGLGIAIDHERNVIICGYVWEHVFMVGDVPKLVLLKLNSSGDIQWVKYGGATFHAGIGEAMVMDSEGNIYVAGMCPPDDMMLVKFDSEGDRQWLRSWSWGANTCDWGKSIVLDESESFLYCAGYSNSSGMVLLKYDLNGTLISEVKGFGGIVQHREDIEPVYPNTTVSLTIGMDSSGNIYVPTFSGMYGEESNDLAVYKFDRALNQEWCLTWGGDKADYGFGVDVCSVNGTDYVAVVGKTYSFGDGSGDGVILFGIEPHQKESEPPKDNETKNIQMKGIDINFVLLATLPGIAFGLTIGYFIYFKHKRQQNIPLDQPLSSCPKFSLERERSTPKNNELSRIMEEYSIWKDKKEQPKKR